MSVAEPLYEEFEEAPYAPPPLLARMVDAGLLGRTTGRGFHSYGARIAAVCERREGPADAGERAIR